MGVLQKSQKFPVRVWKCCRTHKSSGYCGTGVRTELTEAPGGYKKCCTRTPGVVARGVQNLQNFRVQVCLSYRTHKFFGYGYESLTELQEVPGIVARAYITYRSSRQVKKCRSRTPGICGTGIQILHKFRVRI